MRTFGAASAYGKLDSSNNELQAEFAADTESRNNFNTTLEILQSVGVVFDTLGTTLDTTVGLINRYDGISSGLTRSLAAVERVEDIANRIADFPVAVVRNPARVAELSAQIIGSGIDTTQSALDGFVGAAKPLQIANRVLFQHL